MCQEEGGYYAIKGFLYQYDKAILEILSRDEGVLVYIERIQDIDCENYVLQVKHKEAVDYSASKIREPIIKLLDTSVNDASKKFCLYAYFKNQKPHSVKYKTVQELKNILKYRDKKKTEDLQDKYTSEQLETFIENFTLQFAENYEKQFEDVLKKICEKMKVKEDEAWICHAIICDKLFKVTLENEDDKRCITYREVKEYVDKCKTITFESKYRNIVGREGFLKSIKRKYFTFNKPNINSFERLFIIECNAIENATVVRHIIDALKNKYYKAGKSPAPYVCFRGLDRKVLNDVKIGMVDDEQIFSDGTYFDGDIFRADKLVNDKNAVVKFVFEEKYESIKVKFKEVYDFYLCSPTSIFEDIIAIPPSGAEPAHSNEIQSIFYQIDVDKRFCFSKLLQDTKIEVPVDGDRFFNKHFAIVGSTGSGKSHTVAKILQEATQMRSGSYKGLNNSHIVIFDIHSEYKNAFPNSNYMDVSNLKLPYWLMNGEELEEIFVETGENQAYNQINLLRRLITRNKQIKNADVANISFDTPVRFSIKEVLNAIINLSIETRDAKEPDKIRIKDNPKTFKLDDDKFDEYFSEIFQYDEQKNGSVSKGIYNDGSLEKFISRIRNKIMDKRFGFLFGNESVDSSLEVILTSLIGYATKNESNTTIIDLSGVPFEVLSITVSLISRMLFECSYYLKQINGKDCVAPLLLVYEEAHKYVPKIKDSKYNSSRIAIERIAKEGRKYGITLAIVSQRPSEISETIFSQCSNFVVMRLTNPQDQNYVQRLLPDNIGNVTNSLPSLGSGHAIIIGDSIIMPSLVKIEQSSPEPDSNDIKYLQEWKKQWRDIDFGKVVGKYER